MTLSSPHSARATDCVLLLCTVCGHGWQTPLSAGVALFQCRFQPAGCLRGDCVVSRCHRLPLTFPPAHLRMLMLVHSDLHRLQE